jgi:hypothetical protein
MPGQDFEGYSETQDLYPQDENEYRQLLTWTIQAY